MPMFQGVVPPAGECTSTVQTFPQGTSFTDAPWKTQLTYLDYTSWVWQPDVTTVTTDPVTHQATYLTSKFPSDWMFDIENIDEPIMYFYWAHRDMSCVIPFLLTNQNFVATEYVVQVTDCGSKGQVTGGYAVLNNKNSGMISLEIQIYLTDPSGVQYQYHGSSLPN